MNVGFIGLGNIGKACALHLAASEFELYVHDINSVAVKELEQAGASALKDSTSIAKTCELVFLSLPGPAQVEQVLFGDQGISTGAHEGLVVVDLSTISLTTARNMYARARACAFSYLDCPVSGGQWAIAEKNLALMPSGDEHAFNKALPAMQVFGKDDTAFLGESGTGTMVKLINNQIFLMGGLLFQEGLLLGAKAGLDIKQLTNALRAGSANFYLPLASMVTNRQWEESSYDLALAEKDLYLALESARDVAAPLPMTQAAHQIYLAALAQGLGDKFFLGTMEALERAAAISVPATDVDN